ncbi:MAG: hypothetical protein QG671_2810 [Actinomycetota bacterium]|nr:hypothetical protein [Actinomycetota bacterium]
MNWTSLVELASILICGIGCTAAAERLSATGTSTGGVLPTGRKLHQTNAPGVVSAGHGDATGVIFDLHGVASGPGGPGGPQEERGQGLGCPRRLLRRGALTASRCRPGKK